MHAKGVERETLADDEREFRGLSAQRRDSGHDLGQVCSCDHIRTLGFRAHLTSNENRSRRPFAGRTRAACIDCGSRQENQEHSSG
jgi:hypothetical protein